MRITRLDIANFRGVKNATLHFENHTLFIGNNNVGKSTVCEALDLVLGPERLSKFPPIEEFDFYNAKYLEEDQKTLTTMRLEVVITDLSEELKKKVGGHIEYWYTTENRILGEGEILLTEDPASSPCLRLETIGNYNLEEDEFEAQTYFSHSPFEEDGELKVVGRPLKRSFGFIYLRALRTGSRALSLERGSLLDIILRIGNIRTGLWEESIKRLKNLDPPIDKNAENLRPLLDAIEKRIGQYIKLESNSPTSLFVTNLTREHLRKTISFFLSVSSDQTPVPFQEVGTGTLNTLVLALLSFIAEIKAEVIFAMEEPEIALPPHTQRRIANYLLTKTTQCFVTSHSPYVIEMFDPKQIQILKRDHTGQVSASYVKINDETIKLKNYKKHSRRGLCEVMLGKGVIVVEGLTEQVVFWAVSKIMEETKEDYYPLDLSGVTIFTNDGDGSMPDFGMFFKSIELKSYGIFDKKDLKTRSEEIMAKLKSSFDTSVEISYKGIEMLLVSEVPVSRQWQLLESIKASGEDSRIPDVRPSDEEVKAITFQILKSSKGEGTAGLLIELCAYSELPKTLTDFLKIVYSDFPRPVASPLPDFGNSAGQQTLAL